MASEEGRQHRGWNCSLFIMMPPQGGTAKCSTERDDENRSSWFPLQVLCSPDPNLSHLRKGHHSPPSCLLQNPTTDLFFLSLLFHQRVLLILFPKFVSNPFTSMFTVTTSVPTTIIHLIFPARISLFALVLLLPTSGPNLFSTQLSRVTFAKHKTDYVALLKALCSLTRIQTHSFSPPGLVWACPWPSDFSLSPLRSGTLASCIVHILPLKGFYFRALKNTFK